MSKTALVTGGARRIGAEICRHLHQQGFTLAIHYRSASSAAEALATELNNQRPGSAYLFQADLTQQSELEQLTASIKHQFQQLDLLVNNASAFYPTPIENSSLEQWDELVNSNLRAPYFLCTQLAALLKQSQGAVINLIDIHAQRSLPGYPIYSIAKAGLDMLTKSMAKELAPEVRVNGVSPGPILWPEQNISKEEKAAILDKTLLQRTGSPEDIAETVVFLASASYITGQTLAVDGGKSLYSH